MKEFMYLIHNGVLRAPLQDSPAVFFSLVALWAVASYFIGSLNFSIIISQKVFKDDVRKYGSKNAGMTNMRRVYGNKSAVIVLLGDMLKTVFAVFIAEILFGLEMAYPCGVCCMLGHCYPVYFKFKGGKGVAALAAMVLTLEPFVFVFLFALFAIIVLGLHYLSLGSIFAALMYPVLLSSMFPLVHGYPAGAPIILSAVFIAVFIVFKHRENIKRLQMGNENKFYLKNKKEQTQNSLEEEEK